VLCEQLESASLDLLRAMVKTFADHRFAADVPAQAAVIAAPQHPATEAALSEGLPTDRPAGSTSRPGS
jgi:hypothetical protein